MAKKLNEHQNKLFKNYDFTAQPRNYMKANKSAIKTGMARKRVEELMDKKAFEKQFYLL